MLKKLSAILVSAAVAVSVGSVYAEEWVRVPLATEAQLDRGLIGGEGCQWIQAIAISRSNPNFMMLGTDVSAVYRSTDGGNLWTESNQGYISRGAASGMTIDPFNENHIISVGSNSTNGTANGLYTSFDGAQTWEQTCMADISSYRDFRDQVAFDPTSYDKQSGICKVAYWSRVKVETRGNKKVAPAIYKTLDGGKTWSMIENSEPYGGMFIEVNELNGDVYAAGATGFYKSEDGGRTFAKKFDGIFTCMETIYTHPDSVYLSAYNKLYKSEDGGESFDEIEIEKSPDTMDEKSDLFKGFDPVEQVNDFAYGWHEFKVSPANPDYMMLVVGTGMYTYYRWYSHDGGKTWNPTVVDNSMSIMPFNQRQSKILFHPTDPNIVYSFGGDWVTKSTDGGKTLRWSNNGNNSVAMRRSTRNVYDPNLWFAPLVDYNSAASTDGGVTWNYGLLQNAVWGGQGRGGYMVSRDYVLGVLTYTAPDKTSHLILCESRGGVQDGIYKFKIKQTDNAETDNKMWLDTTMCYQSPKNKNTIFAGQYVSRDCGETWEKMNGCVGVLSHNADPDGNKELLGYGEIKIENNVGKMSVVYSEDDGVTWKQLIGSTTINDVSYDWKNEILYVAGGDRLYKYTKNKSTGGMDKEDITSRLKPNSYGRTRVKNVAVDPSNPKILYVGGSGDTYVNDASVQRSTDGGKTWEILIRNNRDTVINNGVSGGGEGTMIWVHPETGYAYVTTSCFGTWKIGPPGTEEDHLAPITVSQNGNGVHINWFGNGRMSVEDMANIAYNSKYNKTPDNAVITAYDKNGDRTVDEKDMDIISGRIFDEWDKTLDKYELYKSDDGESFEKITGKMTETEYDDSDVETGKQYWYKVKNLSSGEYTKTVSVTIKEN